MSDGYSNNDKPTATVNGIPLDVLLSTCIDACHRGCEVIRNVHCRSLAAAATNTTHHTPTAPSGATILRETSDGSMLATADTPPSPISSSGGSSSSRQIAHTFKLSTSHNTVDPLTNTITIDPRSALTEADESSQAVVIRCLKSCWGEEMKCENNMNNNEDDSMVHPKLWIVGEEDEASPSLSPFVDNDIELFSKYQVSHPNDVPLSRTLVQIEESMQCSWNEYIESSSSSSQTTQTQGDQLILFIDPLDGTREYIENRIHNVQCLVGITLNGVVIAGAVGLPFGSDITTENIEMEEEEGYNIIEVAYGWVIPNMHCDDGDDNKTTLPWNAVSSGIKYFHSANKMSNDPISSTNNGLLNSLYHENDTSNEDDTLIILSGDSKKPALSMTMHCLEHEILPHHSSRVLGNEGLNDAKATFQTKNNCIAYRKIICGGCGNKILYLGRRSQRIKERKKRRLCQQDDGTTANNQTPYIVGTIAISPPGSSSWDTAAPTSILLSLDPYACITDLIGRPLVYNGIDLTNIYGVVISSGEGAVSVHKELCRRLAENEEFCRVIGV